MSLLRLSQQPPKIRTKTFFNTNTMAYTSLLQSIFNRKSDLLESWYKNYISQVFSVASQNCMLSMITQLKGAYLKVMLCFDCSKAKYKLWASCRPTFLHTGVSKFVFLCSKKEVLGLKYTVGKSQQNYQRFYLTYLIDTAQWLSEITLFTQFDI